MTKACTRCGRGNADEAQFCDWCAVRFLPFPPVPPPVPTPTNGTREASTFWLALAFLGATFFAAYLKLPDLLIGILGGGATSASSYYFGQKALRK